MWTDERVELMKKLWTEGLSASQIAKQMGGITRNAVIGKVHRLGLSGRAAPSKPARTAFRVPPPSRQVVAPNAPRRPAPGGRALAPDTRPVRYVDETPGTATVLTLGGHMCKWPIGDPMLEGFTFCGRRVDHGSYCHEHGQVAYQPTTAKKKANGLERLAATIH